MELKIYQDKKEVAKQFSKFLADFFSEKEIVHIALSGGSTPKIVFDELASIYKDKIDWEKVHLYWGDERCVPPTDDASNFKMTFQHLLSKITIPKENIHRILGENDPLKEAHRYSNLLETNLNCVKGTPKFDLVILGMGDDGHTASIFPYEINLWRSKAHCVVATHPDSGQKRVSINGKVINQAKVVTFLVTGESKAEKVKEIINKEGHYKDYPASLVEPKSNELLWFLDKLASKDVDTNLI